MEITEVKQEADALRFHKKAGGRPLSEGWSLYNFTRLETRGAQCGKCQAVIKNTSNSRMVAHYKRCSNGLPRIGGGPGGPGRAGKDIQSIIQNKIEFDDSDNDNGGLDPTSILWTSHNNSEGFEDESAEVNHAMGILNGDNNQQHRKPQTTKRPRPIEFTTSQSFDAAISSFLIGCNLTFDIVDSIHFKNFIRYMNPGLPIPSSSQLKTRVLSQLQKMQNSAPSKRREEDSSDSE